MQCIGPGVKTLVGGIKVGDVELRVSNLQGGVVEVVWATGTGVKTLVGQFSSNFARELGVQSKSSAFLRLSVYDEYQVCIILSIPSYEHRTWMIA